MRFSVNHPNLDITKNQIFLIAFLSPLLTNFKALENAFENKMSTNIKVKFAEVFKNPQL